MNRGQFSWALFDWANQPFFTVITTFIFAPYFANVMIGDAIAGQAEWAFTQSVSGFAIGVVACHRTGADLGVADHGAMVWDEIVAIVLVLSLVPRTFWWQLAAFALFRLFDVTKPPPIRGFERRHKNGFGVMADDVIAAFFALLVLAVAKRVLG